MPSVECILNLSGIKNIIINADKNGKVKIGRTESLSDQDLALIFIITQGIRCYSRGIEIENYFDPYHKTKEVLHDPLYKCEWMESGKLKLRNENYNKKFKHANTPEEALKRHRIFTCNKSVYDLTPKTRIK